jgi:ubiquinone/menaquinone biosynthesis C-methylase UbiE
MKDSAKFWDKFASRYDRYEERDASIYSMILDGIRKHLKKSDHVLDFACGTGLVANEIAGNVHDIVGIDISSKMLEIAKSKQEARKIGNVKYIQSDIFSKDLSAGEFDAVIGSYIIHLLGDPESVIKRINSLLKPGGSFISVTPCLGESGSLRAMLWVAGVFGLVPKTRAFKTSGLETLIKSCGFEITEIKCLHKEGSQNFIVAKKV